MEWQKLTKKTMPQEDADIHRQLESVRAGRNGGKSMKEYIVTTEAGEIFRMRANDITDLPVEINDSEVIVIARNKEEGME